MTILDLAAGVGHSDPGTASRLWQFARRRRPGAVTSQSEHRLPDIHRQISEADLDARVAHPEGTNLPGEAQKNRVKKSFPTFAKLWFHNQDETCRVDPDSAANPVRPAETPANR